MFALTIELLTGRYAASAYNDREAPEWPPHPARLFSALTAAWAEWEPSSPDGAAELAALQWLEQLPAPRIQASSQAGAGYRTVAPVFVPVNDAAIVSTPDRSKLDAAVAESLTAADAKARAKAEKAVSQFTKKLLDDTKRMTAAPTKLGKGDLRAAAAVLPERRTRQPRTFPCVVPEVPVFSCVWDEVSLPDGHRRPLQRLLARLVRLGHSSSFVAARMTDAAELSTLSPRTTAFVPNEEAGELVIRWVSTGQIDRLSRAFELHGETEPRVLPARFVRYSDGKQAARAPVPGTLFAPDLVVFSRVGGPRLSTLSTVGVARQLRRALLAAAEQPLPELLSGHRPDGAATDKPHLAILPLPFVGAEHADGAILGIALALPRGCDSAERAHCLRAIAQLEAQAAGTQDDDAPVIPLHLGEAGTLELSRVVWGESTRKLLRPLHWTRASRQWATATPVALDQNPGDLHDADAARRARAFDQAAASVRASLKNIGPELEPLLTHVDVLRSCVLPGNAKPRNFPRFPIDRQRPQRVLVHVRLTFAQPVSGPIILGAGRYLGLGLCLPTDPPSTGRAAFQAEVAQ